jgi:PKD repeat protein
MVSLGEWEEMKPQQFSPYSPSNDLLLPSDLEFPGIFYDDPSFPLPPSAIAFVEPIKSVGPNANWIRNPITGHYEVPDTISTFTAHRSPLGLTIDTDSLLNYPYNASAFVLAYTESNGSTGYLDDVDQGEDLCQIKFITHPITGEYVVEVYTLIQGFEMAVDAVLVQNKLYVMEYTGAIYEVTFPIIQAPTNANFNFTRNSNCQLKIHFTNTSSSNYQYLVWDFGDGNISTLENPVYEFASGGIKNVSLTLHNSAGSINNVQIINIPSIVYLNGTASQTVLSGVDKIETAQSVLNQTLFAQKSIELKEGFKTQAGAVFNSKIAIGCQ